MEANFFYNYIYDRYKDKHVRVCVGEFVNFFFEKLLLRSIDWIFSSPEHNMLEGSF